VGSQPVQHLIGLDDQRYPRNTGDELGQLPGCPPCGLQCGHACAMAGLGGMAHALLCSGIVAISGNSPSAACMPFCFVTLEIFDQRTRYMV